MTEANLKKQKAINRRFTRGAYTHSFTDEEIEMIYEKEQEFDNEFRFYERKNYERNVHES